MSVVNSRQVSGIVEWCTAGELGLFLLQYIIRNKEDQFFLGTYTSNAEKTIEYGKQLIVILTMRPGGVFRQERQAVLFPSFLRPLGLIGAADVAGANEKRRAGSL